MTDVALAVLAGLKYAQVIEDGMVFLGRERREAVTSNEDGPCRKFDLSPYSSCIDSVLSALVSEGLLEPWDRDPDYYHVTHKGWHYAEQLAAEERARSEAAQKEADQLAEERAKQKRDKVFDVFLVLLGSALTLLVEHFSAVADFIAGLFRK